MRLAASTACLGAGKEPFPVPPERCRTSLFGDREAGPSRSRIELVDRVEQRRAAGGAPVDTVVVRIGVLAREGALRSALAEDPIPLGPQLRQPLLLGLRDLVHDELLALGSVPLPR